MLSHQVYFTGCRVLQSCLAKWKLGILQRVPQSYHLWKWKILEVIIGNEVSVQLDSGQFRQAASLFLAPVSFCLYGSWDEKCRLVVFGEENWQGHCFVRVSLPFVCLLVVTLNSETPLGLGIAKPLCPFFPCLPAPVINPKHTDLETQAPSWPCLWRVF